MKKLQDVVPHFAPRNMTMASDGVRYEAPRASWIGGEVRPAYIPRAVRKVIEAYNA